MRLSHVVFAAASEPVRIRIPIDCECNMATSPQGKEMPSVPPPLARHCALLTFRMHCSLLNCMQCTYRKRAVCSTLMGSLYGEPRLLAWMPCFSPE